MIQKPAWGLKDQIPHDAVACWGARAILRRNSVEILPDRQECINRNAEFLDWLRSTGLSWLEERAPNFRGDQDKLWFKDDGRFHIVCNTNASHGYLYISAWMDAI